MLALVSMEMSKRCTDDLSAKEALMLKAFEADASNASIQDSLLDWLMDRLNTGNDENESVLISLLFTKHDKVPDELLPKLSLREAQIQQLAPSLSMKLADQLAQAKRGPEGASIAVVAAKAFDACGSKDDAQKAYIRAYHMDRRNEDAAHGVVESCSLASKTCAELRELTTKQQEQISKLEAEIQAQKERFTQMDSKSEQSNLSVVWTIPEADWKEAPGLFREIKAVSPQFGIGHGVTCKLTCSRCFTMNEVRMETNVKCAMSGEILVDSSAPVKFQEQDLSSRHDVKVGRCRGRPSKITVKFNSLRTQDNSITCTIKL